MPPEFKADFLLDPDITFLNHGSFGACPRPVFENYQYWQRELELNPVAFLGWRCHDLLADARAQLGAFLGAPANDVVFFPNPTTAANMIARSLRLEPGDEILTTDHEYGAMDRTWRFNAQAGGFKYIAHPMPLPMTTPEAFVEDFWTGVTERTKVIFMSHITSATALIFPVRAICARARAAGILTIIDGAHAPSQLPINMLDIGADLYIGACHKWLCAPKGSAFLYARPEVQSWLMPLVVSWGFDTGGTPEPSQFISYHEWQGTRDISSFLATPAAIRYQAEHDWNKVRAECHSLLSETRQRLHALTGAEPVCPDSTDWYSQMANISLPLVDTGALARKLHEHYHIVIPVMERAGRTYLRISCQAYNTQQDMDTLVNAIQ
ncbi:MAG: aminotransferase class V-fold PLP-dependent enzyme, partial [Anaerolineales bacterium]